MGGASLGRVGVNVIEVTTRGRLMQSENEPFLSLCKCKLSMYRCDSPRAQKWKKRARNVAMACFFLAGGIEYSVIFPTMWDYVRSFGGKEWLYGLCLSAFSISNFFTAPLYGLVFDKTHKTLFIVLFANLFEIGGNFLYFAATSKHMILGSRFIVGMGAGAGAAIFGELARTSTKKERTFVFSVFMSMRQIGLIIGPALNLFLRKCNFNVGIFKMSKFTAPGALMMIVFIAIELLFLAFFFELPSVHEEDEREEKGSGSPGTNRTRTSSEVQIHTDRQYSAANVRDPSSNHSDGSSDCSITSSAIQIDSNRSGLQNQSKIAVPTDPELDSSCKLKDEDYFGDKDEKTPLLVAEYGPPSGQSVNSDHKGISSSTSAGSYGSVHAGSNEDTGDVAATTTGKTCCERIRKLRRRASWLISEFMREEIVVLLAVIFVTVFDQTSIEAMLVPLVENLLWWNERDTSFFYSAAGAVIIVGFIFVSLACKKFEDRWLMVGGLSLEVFAWSWFIGTIGNATHETPWVLWRFIIGAGPGIFGLPLFFVTGASLYSKFLPMHIQGFGQGIRRSVFSIAAILGPLWGGGGSVKGNYYVLFAVPLGLLLLILTLVFLSFTKLREPGKKSTANS